MSVEEEEFVLERLEKQFLDAAARGGGGPVDLEAVGRLPAWLARLKNYMQVEGCLETIEQLMGQPLQPNGSGSEDLCAAEQVIPSPVVAAGLILQWQRDMSESPSINSMPTIDEADDVELPMTEQLEDLREVRLPAF